MLVSGSLPEGQLGNGVINGTGGHKFSSSSPQCGIAILPLGGQGRVALMSPCRLLGTLPPSQGKGGEGSLWPNFNFSS